MHPYLNYHREVRTIPHLVGGQWRFEKATATVTSPWTGAPIGERSDADLLFVDQAIHLASVAASEWARLPLSERCRALLPVREALLSNLRELAATASFETGATVAEAEAATIRGVESLDAACSLQHEDLGAHLAFPHGVFGAEQRTPLGVVAGITPFSLPTLTPLWLIPWALALGNAFAWKPSPLAPLTSVLLAKCFKGAGLPPGLLTMLHGGPSTASAVLEHPLVRAVAFLGRTDNARQVFGQAGIASKRCLALGGAKNHLVLMPDADPALAAHAITEAFTHGAGQHCFAGSVLLAVGPVDHVIDQVLERARALVPGQTLGPIHAAGHLGQLYETISRAEAAGAKVVLDGRGRRPAAGLEGGCWLGPTVLDRVVAGSEPATRELLAPILSIVRVHSLDEALSIDATSGHGQVTCIFTSAGAVAEKVLGRARSGQVGINLGVPLPRAPLGVGGTGESRFGHGELAGPGAIDFWTDRVRVLSRWSTPADTSWLG